MGAFSVRFTDEAAAPRRARRRRERERKRERGRAEIQRSERESS
jgi:hypothetical protein